MNPASKPLICYVTDRKQLAPSRSLMDSLRGAVARGANWIQLREKDLPACELMALTHEAVQQAASSGMQVFVNDRLDVALAARAHGVHLGSESLPAASVVRWLTAQPQSGDARSSFVVGVSCHSVDEVIRAEGDGAGYVFLGPVFPTPSKAKYGAPLGLGLLGEACRAVRIPVLAIGGVGQENSRLCIEAGAAGFAAIRFFQDSTSPLE